MTGVWESLFLRIGYAKAVLLAVTAPNSQPVKLSGDPQVPTNDFPVLGSLCHGPRERIDWVEFYFIYLLKFSCA